MARQRLQKLLADAGIASRRQIERLITNKQIEINGKLAELGSKASCHDRISISGKQVNLLDQSSHQALIYHKPLGIIVSRNDPQARKTIFDNLPRLQGRRWIAVGRLDINTSGLLLLCTDGQLAHKLMHPSSEIERTYLVRVRGTVSAATIEHLSSGVMLDDGVAHFKELSPHHKGKGSNQWFRVVLGEGRNRLVRRLWSSQGLTVSKLIRIGFGSFELPADLSSGEYRTMTNSELKRLYHLASLPLP